MATTPDDPGEVALRIPVYLQPSDAAARNVCLFQYPLRPRWRPYNLDELRSARARPRLERGGPRVELTLGMECGPANHDPESPSPLSSISLASTTTMAKTSYAIGCMRTDEDGTPVALCLTPLDAAVLLRPSFKEIDDAAKEGEAGPSKREEDDDEEGDGGGDGEEGADEEGDDEEDEGGGATVAPHFRPAQSEREIEARKNSHQALVDHIATEPWSAATLHRAHSEESRAMREVCFKR